MATKRKSGLGRGLEALIRDTSTPVSIIRDSEIETETESGNMIRYISVDDIKPNSMQPRMHFDEETIEGLAISIEKHGVMSPVMLRKTKQGYELVSGERRVRAARKAGLSEIPAIIRALSEEENALFAIIENTQREDLNPMEEANAYRKIMDLYKMTQEQVAKNVGKSRPQIANTLRLLKYPTIVRAMIEEGDLSLGHANALGAIKDEKKQIELAKRIVRDGLSVREAEALSAIAAGKTLKKVKSTRKMAKSEEIRKIEDELTSLYGTKVTILYDGKSGAIQIHFYSKDELDGLLDDIEKKYKYN